MACYCAVGCCLFVHRFRGPPWGSVWGRGAASGVWGNNRESASCSTEYLPWPSCTNSHISSLVFPVKGGKTSCTTTTVNNLTFKRIFSICIIVGQNLFFKRFYVVWLKKISSCSEHSFPSFLLAQTCQLSLKCLLLLLSRRRGVCGSRHAFYKLRRKQAG